MSELLLNATDRLTEILEDGFQVHVQLLGNLLQRKALFEAQAEDGAVRLLQMVVGIVAYRLQRLCSLLYVLHVRLCFYGIEVLHLLPQTFLPDTVYASIAHCRQQIGPRL